MLYTIGEMAKKLGVPTSTLRYYDKEGLLPFVERSDGGIRVFKDTDYEWLFVIECLKKAGMPLKDIRIFIGLAMKLSYHPATLKSINFWREIVGVVRGGHAAVGGATIPDDRIFLRPDVISPHSPTPPGERGKGPLSDKMYPPLRSTAPASDRAVSRGCED